MLAEPDCRGEHKHRRGEHCESVEHIMKSKVKNLISNIIMAIGILLRFIAYIFATPSVNQHDVLLRYGHFDYAVYLFKYGKLPPMAGYEFAQPPINAFLQSLLMRFLSLFKDYGENYLELYSHTKILSFIYSVLILIIIYKIIKEFDISNRIKNFILAIMAFYPGIIIMTTQYSNDNISYMFFYLSLYFGIRWCKNKDLKTIVLLALSIGIGMLTKISVGLIAFVLGPMMLIIWIGSFKRASKNVGANSNIVGVKLVSPSITKQLIIFALIVFPIGLSYSIRNLVRFDIPLGAISEIAIDSPLDLRNYAWTFTDRFLSFPLNRVVEANNGIYHDFIEYNAWIDMIKTATFDEFNFSTTAFHTLCTILYFANIAFFLIGIITIILNIRDLIVEASKNVGVNLNTVGAKLASPNFNLKIIGLLLFFLAIFAYVSFNIKYPYSCNTNYRYVAYITFALAINIGLKCCKST